jgi:hypothetical protein
VTFVGCVYQEKDVPGRTPNAAERAGIMEDYILVNASPKGEKTSEATPGATGTSGMTTAKPKMFKLENPDDERLRALVGKRVEVTGKVDPERSDAPAGTNPQPDESIGPDRINLPELEVISITETEGTCPSKPEIGK